MLLQILGGLLTAGFGAQLLNQFTGGRLGNILSRRGNKSDFDLDMERFRNANSQGGMTSSNIGLNLRLLDAMRKRSTTTAEKKQQSALTFLGDRSRKLDDATDIDMENEQVLQGIPNFQGLITPTTVVPAIENPRILNPGFEGVRLEIEKINRNIDALKQAMIISSALEAKYRQSLIDDMEKALAEKGKDRSKTRTQRSIFNLITRPKEQVVQQVGSLANSLTNALMLSLGLEVGGNILDLFNKDKENNEGNEEENKEKNLPPGKNKDDINVGDYVEIKNEAGDITYKVWNGSSFDETDKKPLTGKKIDVEASAFTPITQEDINNELLLNNEINRGDNNNELLLNNEINRGDNNQSLNLSMGGSKFNLNLNSDTLKNRKPVDSMNDGQTQIIDLRTAQNLSNQEQPSSASTALDNAIEDLDPNRRFSPYEAYVRNP